MALGSEFESEELLLELLFVVLLFVVVKNAVKPSEEPVLGVSSAATLDSNGFATGTYPSRLYAPKKGRTAYIDKMHGECDTNKETAAHEMTYMKRRTSMR